MLGPTTWVVCFFTLKGFLLLCVGNGFNVKAGDDGVPRDFVLQDLVPQVLKQLNTPGTPTWGVALGFPLKSCIYKHQVYFSFSLLSPTPNPTPVLTSKGIKDA